MSVNIINSFKFSGGNLFELKFNDLSQDANKSDRFQWYLCLYDKRYDLKFVEMTATLRHFTHENKIITLDITNKLITIIENDIGIRYKIVN